LEPVGVVDHVVEDGIGDGVAPVRLAAGPPLAHIATMAEVHSPAGWFVHVKTTDIEDTPTIIRHFYVAEPDRTRAEEIAANLGETAEAIHPLSQHQLDRLNLAPGQKKEHDYEP
jgi:hypothetical protein